MLCLLRYSHVGLVFQFNLVCSDQWKQPLTSVFYFLGGLLGCFVSGQISDRYLSTKSQCFAKSMSVRYEPSKLRLNTVSHSLPHVMWTSIYHIVSV